MEAIRFIHAANVGLDVPLNVTERLADDVQAIAEDASFHAFDLVVAACIDHKADFLLLTGNTFVERYRSLRARVTILRAFERLNDHGVPVYVIPGRTDPPDAWRKMPTLPDNVTVCFGGDEDAVAVLKDAKVVATVTNGAYGVEADQFGIRSAQAANAERRPLRISVLPATMVDSLPSTLVGMHGESLAIEADDDAGAADGFGDYDDLGDEEGPHRAIAKFLGDAGIGYAVILNHEPRVTIKSGKVVAHSPGKTQENHRYDDRQSGCSLINVDSTGRIRCAQVATGTVGWQSFELEFGEDDTVDEVIEAMVDEAKTVRPEPSEQLWLIRWTMRGPTHVIESLDRADARRQMIDRFRRENPAGDQMRFVHEFRLLPSASVIAEELPMATDYVERLDERLPINNGALEELLKRSGLDDPNWSARLQSLIPELDHELIASHALRGGLSWFGNIAEVRQEKTDSDRDDHDLRDEPAEGTAA